MEINFQHNSEIFEASITINCNQVNDALLVVFKNAFHENILFRKEGSEWISDSPLQLQHPETYLDIQRSLNNALSLNSYNPCKSSSVIK